MAGFFIFLLIIGGVIGVWIILARMWEDYQLRRNLWKQEVQQQHRAYLEERRRKIDRRQRLQRLRTQWEDNFERDYQIAKETKNERTKTARQEEVRRNWKYYLQNEEDLTRKVEEELADGRVEFLQSKGKKGKLILERIKEPLVLISMAKAYAEKGRVYKRLQKEKEEAQVLAYREELMKQYQLGKGGKADSRVREGKDSVEPEVLPPKHGNPYQVRKRGFVERLIDLFR